MRLRWDYLLVLEILFQGDAARHDGCELDVVHKICAGVFGQVFFNYLATKKANPSDKASDGRGVHYRLHELVVRHGEVYLGVHFILLALELQPVSATVPKAAVTAIVFSSKTSSCGANAPIRRVLMTVVLTAAKVFRTILLTLIITNVVPQTATPKAAARTNLSMVKVYIVFSKLIYFIFFRPCFTGMRDGAGSAGFAGSGGGGAGLSLAMIASRW